MKSKTTVIQNILHPGGIHTIHAVQGDRNTRQVVLRLFEGITSWTIPEEAVALIRYKRADGVLGEYSTMPDGGDAVQIEGNAIYAVLAPQILEVPGQAQITIVLQKEDSQLSSFTIPIQIAEDPAAQLENKTVEIRVNGTFDVSPYTKVVVCVPEPEGTQLLTENGTYDIRDYAEVQVQVPVPEGYLLPEGNLEITSNGTYDAARYSSVSVQVVTHYPNAEEGAF